jgi:hypothetical protein
MHISEGQLLYARPRRIFIFDGDQAQINSAAQPLCQSAAISQPALQRQNTEISKQIFPEKEYRVLMQSQFPHSCVCE